jgi:hypothetical protein
MQRNLNWMTNTRGQNINMKTKWNMKNKTIKSQQQRICENNIFLIIRIGTVTKCCNRELRRNWTSVILLKHLTNQSLTVLWLAFIVGLCRCVILILFQKRVSVHCLAIKCIEGRHTLLRYLLRFSGCIDFNFGCCRTKHNNHNNFPHSHQLSSPN